MQISTQQLAVILAAAITVAGCGGGSGDTTTAGASSGSSNDSSSTPTAGTGSTTPAASSGSNSPTTTTSASATTLSGVAAIGNSIINGTVTAKCVSGPSVVGKTSADGSFTLDLSNGQSTPCILQVSNGSPAITLYGFATNPGQVNITSITDMVLAKAMGGNPAVAFDNFDSAKASTIAGGIQSAKAAVNTYLSSANLGTPTIDLLNGVFKVGDEHDRILDALEIALTASGKSIDDLRTAGATNISLASLLSQGATANLSPLSRPTRSGFITGVVDNNTGAYSWLGVPYATPPVGTLRWTAPVDPVAWGTKTTQQFGNACPQTAAIYDAPFPNQPFSLALRDTFGQSVGNEDCLTLNIWRPNTAATNLPVLFYIHGGSNKAGWSGQYPGARLAEEQNAVVVTVNYRMNVFGWLNHPALKTGDPVADSGNYGTLDLIQGLKFVKKNIAAFGGNPDNVTVSGQSSGGSNALSLLVSPLAAGLFQKAMVFSSILRGASAATSQQFANTLLENLVVRDGFATDVASADAFLATKDNAWIKSYLYGKSASELSSMLGKSAAVGMPTVLAAAPNIIYDGVVQPSGTSSADAIAAIANGNFNNVPLLIGVTSKEGTIFNGVTWGQNAYDRFTIMFNFNPNSKDTTPVTLANLVRSIYLPETAGPTGTCGQPGYSAGYNYFVNVCGVAGPGGGSTTTASYWSGQSTLLNALQSKQPAIYAYNFSWAQQPAPWNVWFGAGHTGDLPFIFGNFAPGWISFGFSNANKPGREALGLAMRNAIGTFIRKGDPNNSSLGTTWTPWTPAASDSKRLIFDADQINTRILMSTAESPGL